MAYQLFENAPEGLKEVPVTSVEYDSRSVTRGSCFVAVKGFSVDGHRFVQSAAEKGASLIVVQDDVDVEGVPVVKVLDTRRELARIAERFYGHPSQKLGVVGITGTNGKTTVSYLLQAIFEKAGRDVTRLGTVEYHFPDATLPAPNTTPESADLQRLMARAATYPNPRCIMEVSSHGLALGRLEGTTLKGAVFTNLTRDHLDFHKDMDDYAAAKKRLFTEAAPEYAVINIDDPVGRDWVGEGMAARVITYGYAPEADVQVKEAEYGWEGARLHFATPQGSLHCRTQLPGKHNVYNTAAALAVAVAEGMDVNIAAEALAGFDNVPGRFETVDEGQDFAVVVDYAHTDNALANLLHTARDMTSGRVICVFGCGGDRDRAKRAMMGATAEELADLTIVTSDNPRTEDPRLIINEVLNGIKSRDPEKLLVIDDRAKAIKSAICLARPGDSVIIAGKGHEDYQIIGREKHHFDDREEARKFLRGKC